MSVPQDAVMLEVSDLHASYRQVEVLHGISLEVQQGEIVALLGANGSGKSTTLKVISGLIRPISGSVKFQGRPVHYLSPQAIYSLGLVHVQEGRQIFRGLSVRDNLILGAANRREARSREAIQADLARVLEIFPPLKRLLEYPGWSLSGGEQQMLAVGQGLMARPKLLMLDEPSLGLAPVLVQELFKAIQQINDLGTAILLVEQNVRMALRVATRAYVLELGRIICSGSKEEMLRDPRIQTAYLGGRACV